MLVVNDKRELKVLRGVEGCGLHGEQARHLLNEIPLPDDADCAYGIEVDQQRHVRGVAETRLDQFHLVVHERVAAGDRPLGGFHLDVAGMDGADANPELQEVVVTATTLPQPVGRSGDTE